MILFHGSNTVVEKPELVLSRKSLDFGPGFYTTINKEQAVDFARKVATRKKEKTPIVSVYNFDEEIGETALFIQRFLSPDNLWLDFVHQNRHNTYAGKSYDLVIGPVANDDVYATLIVYEQGILSIEQTIEAIKIKKLYNQFVFKNEKALSFLEYSHFIDPEQETP
jgi:hypothetical protein